MLLHVFLPKLQDYHTKFLQTTKSPLGILPNIKMNNFNQFFNCRYLQNIVRLLCCARNDGSVAGTVCGVTSIMICDVTFTPQTKPTSS
jgi:hypothetical protein